MARLARSYLLFGLAALLVVGAGTALLLRSRVGEIPLPRGSVADLRGLRDRDDLSVVFILIDTLRADRLSAYGYHRLTSPVMDLIARNGIRFAHVTAQSSWTKTSMTSIWTGAFPRTHGVLRYPHALPEAATTPAEILHDAGFYTAGIWRNGWVASNFGFHQGFDLYHRPAQLGTPEVLQNVTPSAAKIGGTDEDVTQAAAQFVRGVGKQRFLLYLHYMDVHQYVYDDSANFGLTFSDIYDNAIHWVDRNLNAVLGSLQQQGLLERTLVVIASDHGEGFLEHGSEGHARNLYSEVTEVPLLILPPFWIDGGVVVHERVQNVDIWPTILDLVGAPALPGAQGVSLLPAIETAAGQARQAPGERVNDRGRPVFAELDRTWGTTNGKPSPMIAVTEGPWRFIFYEKFPEHFELFDHHADPGEKANLRAEHPEVVAQMQERVAEYQKLPEAPWGGPREVEVGEMDLAQLRALGYAVGPEGVVKEPEHPGTAPEEDGRRQ